MLQGKRVVVLGGTSGIGLAVARECANEHATVVVVSNRVESIENAMRTIPTGASGEVADLSKEDDARSLCERLGPFDHLVFTAGDALLQSPVESVDVDEAQRFLQLRFWGAFAVVKYGRRNLRAGGSIVLTSGSVGERPLPGVTVVASYCGAIEALTRALAVELAPLRVNIVRPTVVETSLWVNVAGEKAKETIEKLGRRSLIGRAAKPEELAQAYVFAMNATYVTGRVIVVDGGASLV